MWTTTLDNGLRVWVNPRPGHASVTSSIVVRAGARYEPRDQSGVAHLTEHLVFTGTAERSEDEIVRFARERGGYRNGHTLPERVYFHTQLGPEWTDDAISWLADVVFSPTLDGAKLDKERNVVFQEKGGRELSLLARVRDPLSTQRLIDGIRGAYFPGSSISMDPAGHAASLVDLTIEDVQAFHARHYRAANSALVVVGDVEPDAVLESAERWLGGLPAGGRVPTPPPPLAPDWPGSRAMIRAPRLSDSCSFVLGARVMGRDDPELWATDLLAEYLMDQAWDDLRIERGLVYKLVSRNWFHSNIGLFQLETEGACASAEEIGAALDALVDRVVAGEVDAARLEVVKRMYIGQWRIRMEPNLGRVEWLSRWALPEGNALAHADGPRRIAEITPSDLTAIAAKWLSRERRTLWEHRPLVSRSRVALIVVGAALLLILLLGRAMWRR